MGNGSLPRSSAHLLVILLPIQGCWWFLKVSGLVGSPVCGKLAELRGKDSCCVTSPILHSYAKWILATQFRLFTYNSITASSLISFFLVKWVLGGPSVWQMSGIARQGSITHSYAKWILTTQFRPITRSSITALRLIVCF